MIIFGFQVIDNLGIFPFVEPVIIVDPGVGRGWSVSVGLMAAFGKTDVVCAFVINAN
jgi:hypothetical protein